VPEHTTQITPELLHNCTLPSYRYCSDAVANVHILQLRGAHLLQIYKQSHGVSSSISGSAFLSPAMQYDSGCCHNLLAQAYESRLHLLCYCSSLTPVHLYNILLLLKLYAFLHQLLHCSTKLRVQLRKCYYCCAVTLTTCCRYSYKHATSIIVTKVSQLLLLSLLPTLTFSRYRIQPANDSYTFITKPIHFQHLQCRRAPASHPEVLQVEVHTSHSQAAQLLTHY
jgi:hypothetical protein